MLERLKYFEDPNFKFDPISHTYTYQDPLDPFPSRFISVTQFISQFKKKFDSEFWAKKKAAETGKTRHQVLQEWQQISETAMGLGTDVHQWIESFYKGESPALPVCPIARKRIEGFLELHRLKLHKLTPVHQEFRLFSKKWKLAGTTDGIFEMGGDYYVGDWKTNKKFTTDSTPNGRWQKLLWPFDDLWDNSLNSYSIQLSLYRLLLEEAGFKTKGSFLVWIGPETKPEMHKAVDLRERLYDFLQKN